MLDYAHEQSARVHKCNNKAKEKKKEGKSMKVINEEWVEKNFKCIGSLIRTYEKGNVHLSFYGGQLSSIEIDGTEIEDIPDFCIPEASGPDDDLCYRLNEEAEAKILELVGLS